ncbi:hypothetical protein LTR84_010340 [Exophiala bonariae]|uniref:J domain-containing protein n=1 Tax=Exophiala bonariae TaxID=1690606 RepID=A0AAV9MWP4_9EURO|nr:hypothetical protein LTR84_010340 [Exophiala bonariae]
MLRRPCSIHALRLATPPTCSRTAFPTLLRRTRDHIRVDHTRPFSSKSALRNAAPSPTHYEILKLPPTATAAELKRQFYILSKETHPDHNRDDPKAGDRFAQISESYSVLANPEKRKRYDRDVMRTHHASSRRHHGSHSSHSSYAGSRPATGLSKRRSAFKGPPPSFYAHGKPSANTAQQAQSSSSSGGDQHMAGTFNASSYTDPGYHDPAFNASAVFKTQTHEDYRRANRRAAEVAAVQALAEDEGNFWTRFIVVSGILVLTVTFASFIASKSVPRSGKGGLLKADGSRRDGVKK